MSDLHSLRAALHSRYALVSIDSAEELKALDLVRKLAREGDLPFFTWSVVDGLVHENFRYDGAQREGFWQTVEGYTPARDESARSHRQEIPDTRELQAALHHIEKSGKPGVYVLLDAHPWLEQAAVQRLLREIALHYNECERTVVLIAPQVGLPSALTRYAADIRLAVPDQRRVREIFKEEIELYVRSPQGKKVSGEQTLADQLVQYVLGLCEEDVRRLLRTAIRDDGAITRDDLLRVVALKRQMFASAALEVELQQEGMEQLGGMENLKRWLSMRREAFTGSVTGLPVPKGMLLLGVQGAGKSLAARCVAASWGVPLVRMDVAALLDKYHGESERKAREALAGAEAMAPCVLWIDEIEKVLGESGNDGDGGLMRRLLGTLLTWMAERKSRVFIAATANDVRSLPPELLRKGRFDETFFVDLPDAVAREAIFRIHLKRRELAPEKFPLAQLVSTSDGFTGAEIEQAIVASLYEAHHLQRPIDAAMIVAEMSRSKPLSVMMAERVAELRDWASERAVSA